MNVESDVVKDLFYLTRGNEANKLFYGTNYYDIYYKNDFLETSTLSEDFKKLLSYYTLDRTLINTINNNKKFMAEDLKKQYITIFGNSVNYVDEDIFCNCPSKIIYLPLHNKYVLDGAFGMLVLEGYNNKIIEARKYNDKIEIYEKVVFYIEDEDTGEVSYYNDSEHNILLANLSSSSLFVFDDYEKNVIRINIHSS